MVEIDICFHLAVDINVIYYLLLYCYKQLPVLLCVQQARCVDASGQLIVRLVSYSNSEGSSYAGKCCDSRLVKAQWTCDPGCDHYFEICADLINGYNRLFLVYFE